MGRGVLTEEVKALSVKLLGEEFNVRQLRLLPYLMFTILDNGYLDSSRLNNEERDILKAWEQKGYLDISASVILKVSSKFYDAISQLLKMAYVGDVLLPDIKMENESFDESNAIDGTDFDDSVVKKHLEDGAVVYIGTGFWKTHLFLKNFVVHSEISHKGKHNVKYTAPGTKFNIDEMILDARHRSGRLG